jgi:hypothetical protein
VIKLIYACGCICLCDAVESLGDRIKDLTKRLPFEVGDARTESLRELKSLLEFERDEPVNSKVKTLTERVATSPGDVASRTKNLEDLKLLLESQRPWFGGLYFGAGVSRKYAKNDVSCPISEPNPAPAPPVVLAPPPVLVPPPVLPPPPTAGAIAVAAGAVDGGVLANAVAAGVADVGLLATANAVVTGAGAAAAAVTAVTDLGVGASLARIASAYTAAAVTAAVNPQSAAIAGVGHALTVIIGATPNDIAKAAAAAAITAATTVSGGTSLEAVNAAFAATVAVDTAAP